MSHAKPKKVIIPKGMVDPNETTIVEIPNEFINEPTVIACPPHKESVTYQTSNEAQMFGNKNNIYYDKQEPAEFEVHALDYYPDFYVDTRGVVWTNRNRDPQLKPQTVHRNARTYLSRNVTPDYVVEKPRRKTVEKINEGIIQQIAVIEEEEKEKLVRDLKVLQNARRKLILNTTNLSNNINTNIGNAVGDSS